MANLVWLEWGNLPYSGQRLTRNLYDVPSLLEQRNYLMISFYILPNVQRYPDITVTLQHSIRECRCQETALDSGKSRCVAVEPHPNECLVVLVTCH